MNNEGNSFSKKVGIIFLEKLAKIEEDPLKEFRRLDFDQEACKYLILQMNKVQKIFDFQVITLFPEDEFSLPEKLRKFHQRHKKKNRTRRQLF